MSNPNSRASENGKFMRVRSIMHIVVGILYLILGIAAFLFQSFGKFDLGPAAAYGMGSLLVIYGAFRIWRGFTSLRQV
jgi:hypothetical protein